MNSCEKCYLNYHKRNEVLNKIKFHKTGVATIILTKQFCLLTFYLCQHIIVILLLITLFCTFIYIIYTLFFFFQKITFPTNLESSSSFIDRPESTLFAENIFELNEGKYQVVFIICLCSLELPKLYFSHVSCFNYFNNYQLKLLPSAYCHQCCLNCKIIMLIKMKNIQKHYRMYVVSSTRQKTFISVKKHFYF